VSLTQRGIRAAEQVRVTALDVGDGEWVAVIPRTLSPSETVSVTWSDFKKHGQPMSGYIGRDHRNFIMSCFLETSQTRWSAGVRF
jgi:hypothetical protein